MKVRLFFILLVAASFAACFPSFAQKKELPAVNVSKMPSSVEEFIALRNSYFQNTSPKNGYALPKALQIKAVSNPYSGKKDAGDFKIYIACSGADSDRPIRLKRNNRGLWKAHEFSSLLPEVEEDDDF